MNSIKVKLMAIYAAVILAVMIVSGTVMLWTMRELHVEQTESHLRAVSNKIYNEIVQEYERDAFYSAAGWATLLFGHDEESEIQGMILSEAGIVIAPDAFRALRPNSRAVVAAFAGEARAVVGRPGQDIAGRDRQQWISFAMPVTRDDENFYIYTRTSTKAMNESLASIALILVVMVLVSIVLTLIMWFFLANAITEPIINLTRHTKAIASGDFSSKMVVNSKDEIGQLAQDFNYMAQELHNSLMSITREKNKSVAILQNTSHGVLAYDAAGTLSHANNASLELLHGVDLLNSNLQSILELLGFDSDDIYNLQPEEIREVTYQDKDHFILACVTSYASQSDAADGYIIVLQDVSRQVKLDNMRKEFVANVSHELRTPLTSIRTYAETLMDGAMEDKETAKSFLKVIDDEAQRMTLLVSDLLELSRIDSKQAALEMDVVDIVALLRLAVHQSQFLANTKMQTIEIETSPVPCFVEANASRINQVITNILSNAIKYSPENTTIRVTMETTDKYYRIFIQDQGMGIPQESIPHIFERFYRVDKARARAMGGTGLGLAIVKEIMEEHGGRVHVTSQMGEGTTMVLRFNKYQA